MACLDLTNGYFINTSSAWTRGNLTQTTPGGVTLEQTTGGSYPGVVVRRGSSTATLSETATRFVYHRIFGSPANFIALMSVETGAFSSREVYIVDTTGSGLTLRNVISVSASSTTPQPYIWPSQGSGALCAAVASSGSDLRINVVRSDNGSGLVSVPSFSATGDVTVELTATQVLVRHGGTTIGSAERPHGVSQVTPTSGTFTEAVVGGDPSLQTSRRTFTIRNNGTDCLSVSAVGSVAPYTVVSTSRTLPTQLDVGATMTVEVEFAPTSVGTFNQDLPIQPTPADGDAVLRCRGSARAAVARISFSSVSFGTVRLGTTSTRSFSVTNTGDLAVNVAIPSGTGGVFTWPGWSGSVPFGGASPAMTVSFVPTAEGAQSTTMPFTSTATGSPHSVSVSGTGCVPRPGMVIEPPGSSGTVAFGTVERGFRTVRLIRVRNPGNGELRFRASVSGDGFGLVDESGSVTAPVLTRTFAVAAVTTCGASGVGSGETLLAVSFHAGSVAGPAPGQLILDSHNVDGIAASFTLPLMAEIVEAVNVDGLLVLDRSGSMADTSGSRTKSAASIAAARLFVELGRLDLGDRLGLVRFNDVPELVLPLTDLTASSQGALMGQLNPTALSPSGATSVAGGLFIAFKELNDRARTSPPPGLRKSVLVLTDGHDNTAYLNPDDGVSYSLLGEHGATPVSVPSGVRLFAVGIGDDIDVGRLGQLAAGTGGQFLHVRSFAGAEYFSAEKYFTQVYMDSVNLATIVDPIFTIHDGAEHRHPFEVLRGDRSALVVLFDQDGVRLPFWLESPTGEVMDLTSVSAGFQIRAGITPTARFLELRFPEGEFERYAGTWKVVVRHPGMACYASGEPNNALSTVKIEQEFEVGFTTRKCEPTRAAMTYGLSIGVGSDFQMQAFVTPGIVRVGEPVVLNAELSEFGLPVMGGTVEVVAEGPDGSIRTLHLADDGAHQDGDANDGNYGWSFTQTNAEGVWTFTFRARALNRDGQPVVREAIRSKMVEGRVPLLGDPRAQSPQVGDRSCCDALQRWLRAITILLAVLLLALLGWFARGG